VAERAVELVVGVLADAARVEDDDIGVAVVVHRDEPLRIEQPGDALGVVLVHLTPERAHDVAPTHRSEATGAASADPAARLRRALSENHAAEREVS
jgi:hypothetical protein